MAEREDRVSAPLKFWGLRCPRCGSWYTDDPESYLWWRIGEVCGNQAMTGPTPRFCSPAHPCRGRLVPDCRRLAAKFCRRRRRRTWWTRWDDVYNR